MGTMNSMPFDIPLVVDDRALDEGEMIKLRLELLFRAISKEKRIVRFTTDEWVGLLGDIKFN